MPSARFQPSFAAGVLGPGLHGRIDIAKYDVALKVGHNVFIHAHGGVSNRAGTEFICEVMNHNRVHTLVPFRRDDNENYILLFGQNEMKVIDGGAVVQSGGADYVAATPYATGQAKEFDYAQSIDVMYFAHPDLFPQKLSRVGAVNWTWEDVALNPQAGGAPASLTVNPKTSGSETYTYRVTSVTDGTEGIFGAEQTRTSCEILENAGAENYLSWPSTGADEYNIYRKVNGVFGFIGFTSALTFTDDNIAPDLTLTPVRSSGIFTEAGDYPARVALYQQRLVFAASENQPETIWMSRAGNYENFTRSRILRATDRLELDLSGDSINKIRGLLQLREMMVFTSAGEFTVSGPNGVMDVTNPVQTQYGHSGAVPVKPLVVDDTALFVDRTGRSVRDLRYAFEQDGYSGNDLSIFASHFFEGRQIASWAFAKSPWSVLWVALDDGTLLSFTYKREHQVWAWCEHDVGGAVESLAVIPEGGRDALYMQVRRTIGGQTKRYVERMQSREFTDDTPEDCFFVDCGISYSGAATATISGLGHLEGETVVALADGDVVDSLTVTGGSVTLPAPASTVHVGLPFSAEIETLPPSIALKDVGSARGRPHAVSEVVLQVEKTRGIKVGTDRAQLNEMVTSGGDLSRPLTLTTGLVAMQVYADWAISGSVVIRQDYPLPMTILGIAPKYSIGRSG